jgi:hypothetical protein
MGLFDFPHPIPSPKREGTTNSLIATKLLFPIIGKNSASSAWRRMGEGRTGLFDF